ncbi:MAG: sulfotransferase family 2 domain-containing protein [Leptolyngbyaceae bacterium]|nr:sulfotransferase family 2 domain-containing protein [Leptolyngbyaceae bacterium]
MTSDRAGQYCLQDDQQVCFVHIPKTAGTTMSAILESRFDHDRICPTPYWRELKVMAKEDLLPYQLFRGHFPYSVSELIPKTPVFITMFRDPIERVISAYEFMKTCIIMHPRAKKVQEKARTLSLKDYVRDPDVNGVVNAQTIMIAGREIQDLKVPATDSLWLEIAKKNLQEFAWVGITERFWESVGVLGYRFGWPPPDEIQRLMVGSKKLRRENLSQDVIDAIAECNQLDLEIYDYAQSLFAQQYDEMVADLQAQYGSLVPQSLSAHDLAHGQGESAAVATMVDPKPQPQLDGGMVRSLLEHHYEACFRAAHGVEPAPNRLIFTFDKAIPGNGWHRLEGLERNEPFRWTGPRNVSTLDFKLNREDDLACEFRILNSTTSEVLQSLSVQADGTRIKLTPLHRDAYGAMFRCKIPKCPETMDQAFTRLSFQVDQTVALNIARPGSEDKRQVGVAMSLVQIFPVDSRPDVEMIKSPIDSEPWFEAIAFLKQHLQPHQLLFAPNAFRLPFADYIPEFKNSTIDLTINYVDNTLGHHPYDWVIIHKGVDDFYVGRLLLEVLLKRLKPVFANSVFVIFAKNSPLPHLGYRSTDVRPAFMGYVKHVLQRVTQVLQRVTQSQRFQSLKQMTQGGDTESVAPHGSNVDDKDDKTDD